MNILFKGGQEFKALISGVDFSFDIENIESAIETSTESIIETISSAVYEIAEKHYNSDNWQMPDFDLKNNLVKLIQKPVATMAFYEHMPFLSVRLSNDSITRLEADNEKTAYKYQIDDLKNSLLTTHYKQIDSLLKFLNNNIEEFPEWANSEEYIESKSTLFGSYKEYHRLINIDNSAYFFHTITSIINEIIFMKLGSVVDVINLRKELCNDNLSEENTLLLPKIRRFLAYQSFADALTTLSINLLPAPWKRTIENEMANDGSNKADLILFVRKNLSAQFQNKADAFYADIEAHIQTRRKILEPDYSQSQPKQPTYNDKFVSIL